MSELAERLAGAFEKVEGARRGQEPDWVFALRRSAIERFAEIGFPNSRDEEWKHTSVLKRLPRELVVDGVAAASLPSEVPEIEDAVVSLVFVDGRLATAMDAASLPEGFEVHSLPDAFASEGSLPGWIGRSASFERRGMVALNTAYMADGAVISLAPGTTVTEPLHMVFVQTPAAAGHAAHVRNLVVAGEGSRASIVEHHLGPDGDADPVLNLVTEVLVGPGAEVGHVKLQDAGIGAVHLSSMDVRVERDGIFRSRSVAVGAALGRNEVRVKLEGKGAECDLRGVYLARGSQQQDQLTLVEHVASYGTSRQEFKGIVDERARGVFNGLVKVYQDAQKTNAEQNNRNLVLVDTAEAHTRPQLDISADDVKCTHGATVGTLDEASLFYLRSRGIGVEEARRLLIRAFAADVLAEFAEGPVRQQARDLFSRWLER